MPIGVPRRRKASAPSKMTHYQALGVYPSSYPEVVQAAFRKLALTMAPRLATDPDTERWKTITAAYGVLKNEGTRRKYDAELALQGECAACKGRGVEKVRKGFAHVSDKVCPACLGSGRS